MYDKSLEVVLAHEPWRQRAGHPEAVDDPMWDPDDAALCGGTVEWEGKGRKYWVCTGCGYIGWSSSQAHRAPQHPKHMLHLSRAFFLEERQQRRYGEGADEAQLVQQADFVAAVALRVAARKNPTELREFIAKLSRL